MNPVDVPPHSAIPEAFLNRAVRRQRLLALSIPALLLGLLACTATLVTQPVGMPAPGKTGPSVDASRLERHVRILTEPSSPRDWEHTEGLDSAATYLNSGFSVAGGRVSEQVFEVKGRRFRNVIATFGPEDGRRIVVGAHYDTCGPLPGADDNASGTAGLLELARLLGHTPPSVRVDLVAYTLEEPPFFRTQNMGSARHARLMKDLKANVQAVVVLEMIGRFSDLKGSQRYPSALLEPFYPDRGDFVAVVGRFSDIGLTRTVKLAMRGASELPVRSINGPRWIPGLDFSDHHPYWDQGFKAVMVTDTSFYRNRDYHTERDTADRLDYARMAQVVEGVYAAVINLGKQAH
jgi:hypothetical protein